MPSPRGNPPNENSAHEELLYRNSDNLQVAIIIPAHNEDRNIAAVLKGLHTSLNHPFSILLVVDDDKDTTIAAALAAADSMQWPTAKLRILFNKFSGAAGAIRTGLAEAVAVPAPYTALMMADNCDSPQTLNTMLKLALDNDLDVVCATRNRTVDGVHGKRVNAPRFKSTLSWLAGISLWRLGLPISDATNSFKLMRTALLPSLQIQAAQGFTFGMELVAKAWQADAKLDEVATVWTERTSGNSRFKLLKWLPSYLRWYGHICRTAIQKR